MASSAIQNKTKTVMFELSAAEINALKPLTSKAGRDCDVSVLVHAVFTIALMIPEHVSDTARAFYSYIAAENITDSIMVESICNDRLKAAQRRMK